MGHSNCRNSPHPALKRKCVCCLTHMYACLHQSQSCIWNTRSLTKFSEIRITQEDCKSICPEEVTVLFTVVLFILFMIFACCFLLSNLPSPKKKKNNVLRLLTLSYEFFFFLNVLWTFINYDFVLMFWEIIKEKITLNKHFINLNRGTFVCYFCQSSREHVSWVGYIVFFTYRLSFP